MTDSTTSSNPRADFGGLEPTVLAWTPSRRLVAPQALDYLTPDQFYQQWSAARQQRREAVSDMSVIGL